MLVKNKLEVFVSNNKRTWLFLMFMIVFNIAIPAESRETKLNNGAIGHWQDSNVDSVNPVHWQASWIWSDNKTPATMSLFRKRFEVKTSPKKALIHITASSLYKLYVNGHYVNRGPARSAPHHQSFDSIDIASLLQIGTNIIAVKVHFQREVTSYQHQARAGLLAQLMIENNADTQMIVSDESWQAISDSRWDKREFKMSRFHQEVNDRVNLTTDLSQWKNLSFDDEHWPKSLTLMRNSGWPSAQKNDRAVALTPPWTQLVPRTIDYLSEASIQATNLIADIEIDDYFLPSKGRKRGEPERKLNRIPRISLDQAMAKTASHKDISYNAQQPLIVKANAEDKARLLVFDFGTLKNGVPEFQIQGNKGDIVEVIGIPFMVDNKFSYESVDANLIDRITLSGGLDNWQAMYFKPTRYLGLVVKASAKPVIINHLGLNQMSYPFVMQGSIRSNSAPWIEQYMQASANTIEAATTDAYTDNYRERRQYAQTGFYAVLGNYYTFRDYPLHARNLLQVSQEQFANGIMPAYGPLQTNDFMVILDSNMLWLRSLHRYLLYSGDQATVKSLLPAATKLLALLKNYTNDDGLIDNPPYSYWLDHAKNDRRGANLNLNGHYIGALEDFAQILNWLELDGSKPYLAQAKKMRDAIQRKFWHADKGLFVDALVSDELALAKQSKEFSEHANAMALALNIATPEQAKSIANILLKNDPLNYVSRENGMTMVTPAMSYFLHKGLANYGYIDQSFTLFKRRFDKMLNENSQGTLWEEWWLNGTGRSGTFIDNGRTRSSAQTESAFAPALFAEYLLGVTPVDIGMKTIMVKRMQHKIKDMAGAVPTPFGILNIEWQIKENDHGVLIVEVPKGVELIVDLSTMNGKPGEIQKLAVGQHKLSF